MRTPASVLIRQAGLLVGGLLAAHASLAADAVRPEAPTHLQAAPAATTDHSVTLLWDKPTVYADVVGYAVFCDGKLAGHTAQTQFTAAGLRPETEHAFAVAALTAAGDDSRPGPSLTVRTRARAARLDVLAFGARGDGRTKNTRALQRAIAACPPGGIVVVPPGVFLTGALFLKSDMTLEIAAGGVLQGSTDPRDYEPMIRNRFEGWELDSYASLINAGRLDHAGPSNVHDVAIRGAGTVAGGGRALAQAEIAAHGLRSRGRLFCLMNCSGLDLQGLTVEQSSSWTIHYIYCERVSCHDLTIRSTVQNGDGIDPDSSRDSFIFNCSFSTGDDCIAIKSGKNPEGGRIGRPTENVRITDCNFLAGHGISIGSETSGGIRHVFVRDCRTGNLIHGLQIKATKDRGAYVEDVWVQDCELRKIQVLTQLPYNNDGVPAPDVPHFRHFTFRDLDLRQADGREPVIVVHGFDDDAHRTEHVRFENLRLPGGAVVEVDQCRDVTFTGVMTAAGVKPAYRVTRSADVAD